MTPQIIYGRYHRHSLKTLIRENEGRRRRAELARTFGVTVEALESAMALLVGSPWVVELSEKTREIAERRRRTGV